VTAPFNSIPASGCPESTPLQTVVSRCSHSLSSCSRSLLGLLDYESRASLIYNMNCLVRKNKDHKGKTASFQVLTVELSLSTCYHLKETQLTEAQSNETFQNSKAIRSGSNRMAIEVCREEAPYPPSKVKCRARTTLSTGK